VRRAAWLVPWLLAALSGCSRCGGSARGPVERVLPRGAVVVLVAPSAARLGERLSRLQALKVFSFLAPTQGFTDARGFTDALMAQLGVDLRSRAALEEAGLDPDGAIGAAVLVSAEGVLALPVKDPRKLHAALTALASKRLGATLAQDRTEAGVQVRSFTVSGGGEPRLGYVLSQGHALLASGAAVARLPGLAALAEADSLASDRELAAQLRRGDGPPDLFAWAPLGSPALAALPFTSALVTGRLTAAGLELELLAPWKPGASEAAAFEARAAAPLSALLPGDAFLTARYQGQARSAAALVLAALGPDVAPALAKANVDLAAELEATLRPGAVAALSMADRPPLDRGLPSLDVRQTNPFAYAHLSGAAALTSSDAGVAALEHLAAVGPRFGAQLKRSDRGGTVVYLTTWAQGEGVHFAVREDTLYFGSPVPRLEALLALDGGVAAPQGEGAVLVRLDLQRLAASVRALPESAWGLGGFAIKATAVRWLEAIDDLRALELEAGSRDGALRARLTLVLQLGAPLRAPP
jgi:hypothetical protein